MTIELSNRFMKRPSGLWVPEAVELPVVEAARFRTRVVGFAPAGDVAPKSADGDLRPAGLEAARP